MSESEEVVRARQFEVVDSSGRTRMRLGLDEDEDASIRIYDSTDHMRASFEFSDDGPGMVFLDSAERARLAVGIIEGQPSVLIIDSLQRGRIRIGVNEQDEPMIRLLDDQGRAVIELAIAANGNAGLTLSGQDHPRAQLFLGADRSTAVSFNDQRNATRVVVGLTENDEPIVGAGEMSP
jgi:hypothetical protein